MVEGGANEVDDARVCEAVMFGFEQVHNAAAPPLLYFPVVIGNQQAQPVISCLERLREIRQKPTRAAFLSVPPADVAALMSQWVVMATTSSSHLSSSCVCVHAGFADRA